MKSLNMHKIWWKIDILIAILCLILIEVPNHPVSALAIVFVSPTGSGVADCSQSAPCTLSTGLTTVDTGGTLYAAAGTYSAISGNEVVLLDKAINFYGGWNGAASGTPYRDPATNVSILDGGDARRVITAAGFTGQAQIDGFTIHNGNATGKVALCSEANAAGCGGGIFIADVSLTVEHCIIEDNVASTATDATYRIGYGGGIYIQNAGTLGVMIQNNIIRYNDASTAATCGTLAITGKGGGIYEDGDIAHGDMTITENEIHNNEAAVGSNCIGNGAGLNFFASSGIISENYVHDNNQNHISTGSGLYESWSDLSISGNRFINNLGADVIYLQDFNGSLISNVIINPEAFEGIVLNQNTSGRFTVLVNNIIAQNTYANILMNGGATTSVTANLYYNTLDDAPYGISLMSNTYLSLTNSIVSHHSTTGIKKDPGGTNMAVYIADTLFHGNTSDGDWDANLRPLSGDPLYVDGASGDYHIQANSAARDTATSAGYAYDFENDARPMGSGVTPYDVGADEFWWKLFMPLLIKP